MSGEAGGHQRADDAQSNSSVSTLNDAMSGTTSLSSDDTVSGKAHRSYVAKSYLQKNELLTEVQRLRIELKRKSDEMEHVHSQMVMDLDDREDKIEELKRENARLRQTLNSGESAANEQMKAHDEILKRELGTLLDRVRGLEELNMRLSGEQAITKQHFRLVKLTDAEYEELKAAELKEELSLSEYVSIRVHEELKESTAEISRLDSERRRLEEMCRDLKAQTALLQRQVEEGSDQIEQLRWTNVRLEKRLVNLIGPGPAHEPQSLFEPAPGPAKTTPSSVVECEIGRLRTQLDSVTEHLNNERERLIKELDCAREALRVAVDEGTMLRRQAIDAGQRSVFLEERVGTLSAQIDTLKSGREEMLEKYLASKDEARTEFNEKLIRELEELRAKNAAEYERLHRQMKEICEQECASSRNSKETAIAERDRALAAEADARSRYEKLLVEFKGIEFSLESQTADLVSQLRVKTFELDRLRSLLDETDANLRATKDASESLREKFDSLLREHQNFVSESTFTKKKLEDELETCRQKLTAFERTETDLDDLVMQAADTAMGNEAERVLVSYGAVAAVPPSFRRRLEQSVRLARRVLELERVNNVLRSDYEKKASDSVRLSQEVADLNNLLSLSRNPDQRLIVEAVRTKDEEIRTMKTRIHELELQLDAARHELTSLVKEKEEMAKDMRILLSHRDELTQIRRQIGTAGGSSRGGDSPTSPSRCKSNQGRKPAAQRKPTANAHHNISPPVLLT